MHGQPWLPLAHLNPPRSNRQPGYMMRTNSTLGIRKHTKKRNFSFLLTCLRLKPRSQKPAPCIHQYPAISPLAGHAPMKKQQHQSPDALEIGWVSQCRTQQNPTPWAWQGQEHLYFNLVSTFLVECTRKFHYQTWNVWCCWSGTVVLISSTIRNQALLVISQAPSGLY